MTNNTCEHGLFSRFFNVASLGIERGVKQVMIVKKSAVTVDVCMTLLNEWGYTDIQYDGNYKTRSYVSLPLSFPWGCVDTVVNVALKI